MLIGARINTQADERHVLPAIRVPTLVIHRTDDREALVEEGRYLAEHKRQPATTDWDADPPKLTIHDQLEGPYTPAGPPARPHGDGTIPPTEKGPRRILAMCQGGWSGSGYTWHASRTGSSKTGRPTRLH
jgi:hypothetical protein